MNSREMLELVDVLAREKNVDKETVFGVLELTNTSALRELTVGSNACQCVGELNLNAPELERLFVGKGAFRDASLLRINTAFLKATEKGSMIVEDDAFPMASLIVDGRVGEASRE